MTESRPWDEALARTRAATWDVREQAVQELGRHLEQREVRDRLQELLDDENTAVGAAAAEQLVLHGGPSGFAVVVDAWAYGNDDAGDHIDDMLGLLRIDGFPLDAAVRNFLATAPNERVREAARQLAEHLGVT